jgi:diguanylate cyclase (GGDEF)-like protein/PAS domain S-box-containing protein
MRAFLSKHAIRAEPSPGLSADEATPAGGWSTRSVWRFRTLPLLVGCGLFLVLTIALGTWAILSDLRNRAVASAERELRNIAMVLSDQTDRTFQSIELVQKNLIDHIRDSAGSSREDFARALAGYDTHLMLRDKIEGLPCADAISIIDAHGNLVNFSRRWPLPDVDVSDRSYFTAFQLDPRLTSFLSEPARGRVTGTWTIFLARKVVSPNGEFLGLVVATIKLAYFEQYFETIALGQDSALALYRSDGALLARYPQRDPPGTSYAQSPVFQDLLLNKPHGVTRLTSIIDGQERLVAGHRLAKFPVVVAAGTTVSAVLSDWRSGAIHMTAAAILMVVVIGGTIFLTARHMLKRQRTQHQQLDAALNHMRQGLQMYDAKGRVILTNQKYLKMYGLPSDAGAHEWTIRDVLYLRKDAGTLAGDPEQYLAKMIDRGNVETKIVQLPDGRMMSVTNAPVPHGGWVSTHEDVTESARREASFRLLFDSNPLPMWVYDRETLRFLAVNDAAVSHYGYSREQFLAMTLPEIRPPEERERISEFVRTAQGFNDGEQTWLHVKADGTEIETAIYSRALQYEDRPAALVAICDVTEQRGAERDRDRNQKFLNLIIENIPVTVFVKEPREQRYILVNRAAEQMWGMPRTSVIGKTSHDIFPKQTADMVSAHDKEILETKCERVYETQPLATPTGMRLIRSRRLVILDDDGGPQYLLGLVEDVTERARAEERIAHMAHHDALTDLPNRVLLRERLEAGLSHVRRGEQLAVHYLDLDTFKNVNDTLGHPAGDELLRAVAERLCGCVREIDSVARLGGDEFAIIQAGLHHVSDAASLAQRIRDALKAPYVLNGQLVNIDASIGIACAPGDGTDADQLLKNADMALYRAKSDGRGMYRFFEPAMDARIKARRALELDMRKAVTGGEFEVHYQPVVDLQSNEICGCEALLRWPHPERGSVSPADFIPVAEETGLIVSLGEWVLRRACADAATWPDDLKIAVNISPLQFSSQNIVPVVMNALAASGLSAHRLELEITEAVFLQNNQATRTTLHQLRELGVRIAMDDFGTGYSSLSYLRSFPFDKIKIDRSFIGDLCDTPDSIAIVRAITNLANNLNMTTTAEGVETPQQLQTVKSLGCTEAQGYLFAPAMQADDFARLFLPRAVANMG